MKDWVKSWWASGSGCGPLLTYLACGVATPPWKRIFFRAKEALFLAGKGESSRDPGSRLQRRVQYSLQTANYRASGWERSWRGIVLRNPQLKGPVSLTLKLLKNSYRIGVAEGWQANSIWLPVGGTEQKVVICFGTSGKIAEGVAAGEKEEVSAGGSNALVWWCGATV